MDERSPLPPPDVPFAADELPPQSNQMQTPVTDPSHIGRSYGTDANPLAQFGRLANVVAPTPADFVENVGTAALMHPAVQGPAWLARAGKSLWNMGKGALRMGGKAAVPTAGALTGLTVGSDEAEGGLLKAAVSTAQWAAERAAKDLLPKFFKPQTKNLTDFAKLVDEEDAVRRFARANKVSLKVTNHLVSDLFAGAPIQDVMNAIRVHKNWSLK